MSEVDESSEWLLDVEQGGLVGGVDISFVKGSHEHAASCLVVLEYPSQKVRLH
jgi:deoxyinosine 3'endonuclease (endonuclease V)